MKNIYRVEGCMVYIYTNSGHEFIIDADDLPKVSSVKTTWGTDRNVRNGKLYVRTSYQKNNRIYRLLVHRLILDNHQGMMIDHINGDGLDNRKSNLRISNHHQNGSNRTHLGKNNKSGFRGVHWNEKRRKFMAVAEIKEKKHYIGCFITAEEANEAVQEFRAKNMPFSYNDQIKNSGKLYV